MQPPARGGAHLQTKSRGAASIQITAEQLLRESAALQSDEAKVPTGQKRVLDQDELNEYRIRKRKGYEDALRRSRGNVNTWISYGVWEAEQQDFRRARSVFERAIEVDYEKTEVWNKYLDIEIKNGFVNSARNVFDRITKLMPRLDHFWLKYITFEEALHNYAGVRVIFEKWMEWEPEDRAWMAYVKFEERCHELDRARSVLERFLQVKGNVTAFIKFAKWEEEHKNFVRARAAFEKALQVLSTEDLTENFFLKFAKFEESCKDNERAKVIYLDGMRRLGKNAAALEAAFVAFSKRSGTRQDVEAVVANKRRNYYEQLLEKTQCMDYDVWFNLLRLEEELGSVESVRSVYERAVQYAPKQTTKTAWKRYFYLWLSWAIYEELTAKDVEKARQVWTTLAEIIPHKQFSFSKFWIQHAHFEIRHENLQKGRLIFGQAIAVHPKDKIFRAYVNVEIKLGEIDRCRTIMAKYVELFPVEPRSWLALIDIELLAEEMDRARRLFEMALSQGEMKNKEIVWKAYVDMESNCKEFGRARDLFERLLTESSHWRVFQAYAEFELHTVADKEKCREIFQRGISHCRENQLDAERCALLEAWLAVEKSTGDSAKVQEITAMLPQKVKKRRSVQTEDGTSTVVEEYTSYIYPDQSAQSSSLAILEAARKWKMRRTQSG